MGRGPQWTGQNRPFVDTSKPAISGGPGAPAARPALEHVCVMQEPVEQRGDGGGVAEELSPLVDRTVGGEHGGGLARSGA